MKKTVTLFLIISLFAIISCTKHIGPEPITDDQIAPTSTATPTPVTYSSSGFISAPGTVMNVYELDSNALRLGGPVYTETSDLVTGAWGPFQAKAGMRYEVELTKSTSAQIWHDYMPYATKDNSAMTFYYIDSGSVPGASDRIMISMDATTTFILTTDTISLDGSANLNNATVSDNNQWITSLLYTGTGDSIRLIDILVTGSTSPGTLHNLTFNGETRTVRVFSSSAGHRTLAVFEK